jgi:hypothetical protein
MAAVAGQGVFGACQQAGGDQFVEPADYDPKLQTVGNEMSRVCCSH